MQSLEYLDAWMFLSVARSEGGTLFDFFSAADHIGVALPTDREMEDGINHLAKYGLVRPSGTFVALTDTGRELFEGVGGLAAAPRPQIVLVRERLQAFPLAQDDVPRWKLDPVESDSALSKYSKRMKSLMKGEREL